MPHREGLGLGVQSLGLGAKGLQCLGNSGVESVGSSKLASTRLQVEVEGLLPKGSWHCVTRVMRL